MIKSINFKNFFSFANQNVDLENLNALVGINGSGKTNFIKAIQLLKSILNEEDLPDLIINKWGGFDAICYIEHLDDINPEISLEYVLDHEVLKRYGSFNFTEDIHYTITIKKVSSGINYSISEILNTEGNYKYLDNKKGTAYAKKGINQTTIKYKFDSRYSAISQLVDSERYLHIYIFREAIKDIAVYKYFNTTESSPIRKPVPPTSSNRLNQDGSNLPQVLNSIKINNRNDFKRIIDALKEINPHFSGIEYNIFGGNIELLLEEDKLRKPIHVTHISDGTLRYLCLLAIIFNPKRGRLVCIDEPEVGLHPDMINEIISVISDNCNDTQFVISTHSEYVLSQLSIKNVLVFEKDDNNASTVKDFKNNKEYIEWASRYSLGKLWRNGDLGGNRF